MPNLKKSSTLGVNISTANNRLRKNIIFWLVKETRRDSCYRCGEKITAVEELSIEHKEPWEGRSPDLYWDLENIAFSHLKCNRPDYVSISKKLRKEGPSGFVWCNRCKAFKPDHKFYNCKSRWTGKHHFCKNCHEEDRRRRRNSS